MSRIDRGLPERLLSGEATDFERRLLAAALDKRPPAAASARVARALGVGVTSIGTAAAAKALAADAARTSATAAAGTATGWTWISAAVVSLAVAGSVVAVRARHPAPMAAPVLAAPEPTTPAELVRPAPLPQVDRTPGPAASRHRGRPQSVNADPGNLADQIALVDAARATLAAGSPQEALDILRGYQARYPAGSFRPEVTASTVEALVKLGREAEARTLALQFVDEQRGTLLAKRVAGLVGLTR